MSYASKVANRQGCGAEVRAGCHLGDVMLGRRGVAAVSCCVSRKAAGCTAFLDARREMTPPVPRAPRPVGESRPTYHPMPRNAARCTTPCREMPPVVPRRAGRGRPAAAGLVQRAAFLDAHPDKTVQRAAFLGAASPRPVQRTAFLAGRSPRLVRPAVFLGTRGVAFDCVPANSRRTSRPARADIDGMPVKRLHSWENTRDGRMCGRGARGGSTLTRDGRKVTRWNLWQRVPRDLSGCSRMS